MKSISFKRLRKRALVGGTVFVLILAFASFSWASTITYYMAGLTFPDTITAKIEMNYVNETDVLGILSFKITNTSSVASSLTAFAFNVPLPPPLADAEDVIVGFSVFDITASSTVDNWHAGAKFDSIDGDGDIGTPANLGFFDMAAVTGKKYANINGGSVSAGIPQTSTFEFLFYLSLISTDFLDTNSFNVFSTPQNQNSNTQIIVARFQGIGDDGEESDIATVVPIPGAIVLLGSGLLGLAGIRRKFFS